MKQLTCLICLLCAARAVAQIPVASSGTIRRFADFPSRYVTPRPVDVWLPDGYNATRKYAVLYMHDGQMLFDKATAWNRTEWQVDETLSRLLKTGQINDCIVVGIWNRGEYRHAEYFPQKPVDALPAAVRYSVLPELKGQPLADNYLRFLTAELKPFIDSAFTTYRDRAHTFTAGSSMGGLISLYALCEYPAVFGGAACLSTHWIGSRRKAEPAIPKAFIAYLSRNLPDSRTHRIYFDHGTALLDSLYHPHQATVDQTMRIHGFTARNWETKVFVGEDHSERAWAKRLAIPVLFLLRKEPAGSRSK